MERFTDYTKSEQRSDPKDENTTLDNLILAYHTDYKKDRAKNPSNYFPNASAERKSLGAAITAKDPNHSGNTLIKFLEEGCTKENLEALLAQTTDQQVLLPYQFMAAFALEETKKEKEYIEAMLREGMLSDVLKDWGSNALRSADGFESIMTNGMQDLLAVRYAQLIKGMNPDVMVANKFIQKCGLNDEASSFDQMWFAPTLEKNVIGPFSARLKIVGMGFAFQLSPDGDRMKQVAGSAQGSISVTPADKGFISSYGYLQKALAESGNQKEAEQLKTYIDKEGI